MGESGRYEIVAENAQAGQTLEFFEDSPIEDQLGELRWLVVNGQRVKAHVVRRPDGGLRLVFDASKIGI